MLNTTAAVSTKRVRLVGLQGRDRAYLWLFNPQAAWSHMVVEGTTPAPIHGATVEIRDLAPGTYRIQWWDTERGKIANETSGSPAAGVLRFEAPAFVRDLACKLVPAKPPAAE